MNFALHLAREYGIGVEFADLGDWGADELRSEYDPNGPCIRVNMRVTAQLCGEELDAFVAHAVGHELYHHREHCGEVPRLPSRSLRECAAEMFARRFVER
ncbi:MAG TPA: hypothetical protein VNF68_10155 [Candidatus Baltobacteraceae bacterium]|nr:hypothetical protein [Candidatus Baltobacteraceae bacterium]